MPFYFFVVGKNGKWGKKIRTQAKVLQSFVSRRRTDKQQGQGVTGWLEKHIIMIMWTVYSGVWSIFTNNPQLAFN